MTSDCWRDCDHVSLNMFHECISHSEAQWDWSTLPTAALYYIILLRRTDAVGLYTGDVIHGCVQTCSFLRNFRGILGEVHVSYGDAGNRDPLLDAEV